MKLKYRTMILKKNWKKSTILLLSFTLISWSSMAQIIDGKFGEGQVWDCQRSPAYPSAGQNFTASNLQDPYKDSGTQYTIENGEYIQFFYVDGSCSGGSVGIKLYNASGTVIETISTSGQIWGLEDEGFLYVADNGGWGTFVTNNAVYNYGESVTYTTSTAQNDCTDLENYNLGNSVISTSISWDGSSNTDWNTAANWSENSVPVSSDNLIIPTGLSNYPIVGSGTNAVCSDIEIESGASLLVSESGTMSISGNLTNNGTFNINSSASGEGSLLISGSLSGSGTYNVQRYLSGSQWHLVSSPITNGLSGVFQNIWIRPYDEATNAFGDYIVPTTTPMPTGQGFSVWADNNETRTFSGTINNGSVGPLSVQLTGSSGPNTGWNLIGNPYPSAIDWDAASGWTRSGISDAVYVWNNTQYSAYVGGIPVNGGSRYVAPGQGFFVQAYSPGAIIGMDNGIRLHNSISFKSTNSEPDNVIRIQLSGNEYSDETVIAIRDADPDAFDPNHDAYKLTGSSSAPQMYILKDDMSNLSIASFSDIEDIDGKALHMDYAQEGQHTISWTHSITGAVVPTLLDQLTGDIIEPGTNYTYDASNSDMPQRFVFSTDPLSVTKNDHSIAAWEYDNTLFINNSGYNENNVSIYNMQGVMIFRGEGNTFDLNFLAPAMYIVKVRTGEVTKTEKIVVK